MRTREARAGEPRNPATRAPASRVGGLATYAWLPRDPWAVLVARTPYGAAAHAAEGSAWAARGVGFVAQDVRGRHESPGEFVPYAEAEHDDGPTLLAWVRARVDDAPVVLHGTSYGAHAALTTACTPGVEPPAGVVAMVPALGLGETARTRGGVLQLASRLGWWLAHDVRRPWSDVVDARRADAERATAVARMDCPLLAIGGTDDFFAHDTLDLATAWGGPARLVMGPWDHSLVGARRAERVLAWLADVVAGHPPTGAETVDRDGVVGHARPQRAVVHLDVPHHEQWCATLLAGDRPVAYGAAYGPRIELGPVVLTAAERADQRVQLSADDFPRYARSLRLDRPVPDYHLELHP